MGNQKALESNKSSFKSGSTNLLLISASKRTAAITGLEPSPVAGKEV